MSFLLQLLRLFVVMLFSALGASTAFSVPMTTSEVSYYQAENTLLSQSTDVGFAARAPPLAVTNVAVTGGVTSMQGSAFALHGQETVAALFGFDADHNATNTGVTRVGDGPLPTGQQSLDPSEISFSQATVNRQTSDGMTHDELVSSMRRDGWQGDPVDVVNMPDGAPTSMDNRRLLAAREAGIPIEANVRNAGDALTPAEVGRFRVAGQPAPTNWGEAIQLRTQRQGGMQGVDPSWPDRFPNGSIYDPDFVGGQ